MFNHECSKLDSCNFSYSKSIKVKFSFYSNSDPKKKNRKNMRSDYWRPQIKNKRDG